ncbi:MAG TPA: AI-2E family transporter [Hyphomicrobiaceae bacterium]|nr:AI-2E family transporter [Hyphomicrobiaceae bacterium]
MPLVAENLRSAYAALVVAALVIAGLVLGRDVFLPLAIACCLAFVLSPIVSWLTKRRIPRAAAVVGITLVGCAGLGAVGTLVISQGASLAAELGTYRANLVEKIRTVTSSAQSDGVFRRATNAILSLETEIAKEVKDATQARDGASPSDTGAARSAVTREPIVVRLDQSGSSIWDHLGVLAHPLATVGLTLLFTVFILLQTQDLRDRMIRVVGTDNIGGTTSAISDAAGRLSSLFLTQALMNVSFGIVVGTALWFIGVPNSALWGGLTILMRFVPYVGSIVAAVPPVLLAAAVDPGWGMAFAALMVFVIGEPLMGHVVEPVVLGKKAGLSPFAMLLSASFWALIWGPIGLILAAPLTLTLVVLGRYIKGLEFLTVLLGDQPALSPAERLYHRLLAADALGAAQHLEEATNGRDPVGRLDAVVLPALRIAALDLDRGQIDRARVGDLRTTANEMMAAFDPPPRTAESDTADDATARRVLVLPARSDVDTAAAALIAATLDGEQGVVATSAQKGTGLTAISAAAQADTERPDMVAIVLTNGNDAQYLPLICRRAALAFPAAVIAVLHSGDGDRPAAALGSVPDVTRISSVARLAEQARLLKPDRVERHARAS